MPKFITYFTCAAALTRSSAALAATANTLNFPAVIGSYTWEWEYLAFTMTAGSGPPPYIEEGVESIGLNQAVDKGAANYYISDGIFLVSSYPEYITLPNDANITGLIAYAGNATEPIVNPWVITENAIYEIQTQNSNAVVALPLGEIAEMNSEKNADPRRVGPLRDARGSIVPNAHFPDMVALTEHIHAKGLRAGIYTSPGPLTCARNCWAWRM